MNNLARSTSEFIQAETIVSQAREGLLEQRRKNAPILLKEAKESLKAVKSRKDGLDQWKLISDPEKVYKLACQTPKGTKEYEESRKLLEQADAAALHEFQWQFRGKIEDALLEEGLDVGTSISCKNPPWCADDLPTIYITYVLWSRPLVHKF